MDYREYQPPPELQHAVHCLWTLAGDAAELDAAPQPVLPDGRPELILHLGDPFQRVEDDSRIDRQAAILYAGQLTSQLVLRPTGRIAVAGLRFRPYGAAAAFGVPQNHLTGRTIPLSDLSKTLGALLQSIRDETDSPLRAVQLLVTRAGPVLSVAPVDPRLRAVVDVIARKGGLVTVDALARVACMTRRHLERRFLAEVGVSPKRLARITRFQRALSVLDELDVPDRGTRTAVECGYADQAHFIRDFSSLAGCPPGEYLLRRGELTGFFSERHSPARPDQ
jgi:AraC-like DNA-binding protein